MALGKWVVVLVVCIEFTKREPEEFQMEFKWNSNGAKMGPKRESKFNQNRPNGWSKRDFPIRMQK